MFPISQVQEPYSSVAYLAQRVPLIELLQLSHPDTSDQPEPHSLHKGRTQVTATAEPVEEIEGVAERQESAEQGDTATAVSGSLISQVWTAWDVCDGQWCSLVMVDSSHSATLSTAWAIKRGFFTPRVARPNTYRAGG